MLFVGALLLQERVYNVRGDSTPVRVISGAYWRQLPGVTAYEASIPVTYSSSWVKREQLGARRTENKEFMCFNKAVCDVSDEINVLHEAFWQ
jgi:hypothetical protein